MLLRIVGSDGDVMGLAFQDADGVRHPFDINEVRKLIGDTEAEAEAVSENRAVTVTSLRPGGYDHAIATGERVVAFLYGLMRDHITPGLVEQLVVEMEQTDVMNEEPTEYRFSNDFLAAYAWELAARLGGVPAVEALALSHEVLRAAQAGEGEAPVEEALPRISQLEPARERRSR